MADDSKTDVFPLGHITFLIKAKKNMDSEIGKIEYITLEMCLLTQSDMQHKW